MMRRITVGLVLLASGALCIVPVVLIATADCHRTNYRYLMWKRGYAPYDPKVSLRYLNVDREFREALAGRTKAEVQRWFPRLVTSADGNEYQQFYANETKDMDFLWIDESNWGIEFVNGRVKDVRLLKG